MKTKIIDSFERLPLGTYLDIMDACKADIDETDRQIRIISLLSGIDEGDLLRMPIADFRALSVKARFLESEIPETKRPLTKTMHLGDVTVSVTTKVTKITTAQYIDCQTFIQQPERLVELLACFLIPTGCEYNEGYDIDEVYTAIRDNLMVTDAQALAAFFFRRFHRLIGSFLIYSIWLARRIKDKETRKKMTEEAKAAWEAFRSAGDGLQMLTRYLIPPASRGLQYGA